MSELAKANLNDDQTISALQELADEHGSKADAIRHAIRHAAGADDDHDDTADEPQTVVDRLSESSLRKALRCLWSISRGRDGGRDNVGHTSADAAMSVLAQEFSVNKAAVKPMYLTPLKAADVIDVDPGADQTIIYVVDPDATVVDESETATIDDEPDTDEPEIDDIDVDDRLNEIDAAEPARVQTDGGRDLTDDEEER